MNNNVCINDGVPSVLDELRIKFFSSHSLNYYKHIPLAEVL